MTDEKLVRKHFFTKIFFLCFSNVKSKQMFCLYRFTNIRNFKIRFSCLQLHNVCKNMVYPSTQTWPTDNRLQIKHDFHFWFYVTYQTTPNSFLIQLFNLVCQADRNIENPLLSIHTVILSPSSVCLVEEYFLLLSFY